MKKRHLKILCIAIIQLFCLGIGKTFAQNCQIEKGVFYLLTFQTSLKSENNRPVFVTCIAKNLDSIKTSKSDLDSFICSIFKNAQYVLPPPLNFEKKLIECCKTEKKKIEKIISKYQKDVVKMDKKQFSTKLKTLDNVDIEVNIVKFIGELWYFDSSEASINNISHQIKVPLNCYSFNKYYLLKEVKHQLKLTESERESIKAIF